MSDNFEIREYRDEDLQALSDHWKASIAGWPPGFEMAGDFSPEGVRLWLLRAKYIAIWLGWLDGKIVGYLSYARRSEDQEATYVQTINALPEYHGHGFGRRMLAWALDRAIRDNVKRVDLHTWGGNEKAVPLYKKTGFFWRPRVSWVQMYNFLPPVLNNPLVKRFLGDTYWYDALHQPLDIEENDEVYNGCCYHKYNFVKDGKNLEVLVDPSTSGIVGIKTDDFEIRCDVPGLNHVAGFPQPVKWFFASAGAKPVHVKINCETPDEIEYSFSREFDLKGEIEYASNATPSPDLHPESPGWYGKPIKCAIEVDGVGFTLKPGIRVVSPFKLDTVPYPIRLIPGETRTITVNLNSQIPDEVEFIPEFMVSGDIEFIDKSSEESLVFKPQDSSGIAFTVRGLETGGGKIEIGGIVKSDVHQARIKPIVIHVGVAPVGKPLEIRDSDPDATTISNGHIAVKVERRGADTEIFHKDFRRAQFDIFDEGIGEPYSSEFSGLDFDVSCMVNPYSASVTSRCASGDFHGIIFERAITIVSGNDLEIVHSLTNNSGRPFTGRIRFNLSRWDVIKIFVPLRGYIVEGAKDFILGGTVPLPIDPSDYSEPWLAMVSPGASSTDNVISGVIFNGVKQIGWHPWRLMILEHDVADLADGDSFTFPPVRVILRASSVQEIQKIALDGQRSLLPIHTIDTMHSVSPVFMDSPGAQFTFHMMRKGFLNGDVTIATPDGKSVNQKAEIWNLDNPIKITIPELPDTVRGLISLDYTMTGNSVTRTGKLPLIVPVPNSSVEIEMGREGDYRYFRVENGCIEYKVAPEFCGSVVSLAEKSNPGVNLLKSPFPNPGMWTWLNPWHGGIRPDFQMWYRFHQSGFEGSPVKVRWHGHEWEGVSVKVTPLRKWQSLGIELMYLTRPGYPVILNLIRISERANCCRSMSAEYMIFACPSGDPSRVTAGLMDEFGESVRVSRSGGGAHGYGASFIAVYDPDTLKTVGIVCNSGELQMWDAAEAGQVVFWGDHVDTEPGQTVEMAAMFVVAENPESVGVLGKEFSYW